LFAGYSADIHLAGSNLNPFLQIKVGNQELIDCDFISSTSMKCEGLLIKASGTYPVSLIPNKGDLSQTL